MNAAQLKAWSAVHKWTSLICSAFLLMLCLTGLPLIFHDEIDTALNTDDWAPANPGGPLLSLDAILAKALENRPSEVPIFMSFDIDRPVINVTTGPRADSPEGRMHFASFDRTSGAVVPPSDNGEGVMHLLLRLHTDMFLGLPGMLFLGAMGILLVIAVISGVVLYAPFVRKLRFGAIRRRRPAPIRWLDYHNLLGIVTVGWILVVGMTGIINTLATPIVETWRTAELADLVSTHSGGAVAAGRASLDHAVERAVAAQPDKELQFIAFPGSDYSTKGHYAVFMRGRSPLTEHIITPALIDARDGRFEGIRPMPWYAKALSLSQPLHFGDYGGLPLKIIWAILDIVTIIVLGSGVYLWLAKWAGKQKATLAVSYASTETA